MNPQHQLQLEDAQKKLSIFKKHLDLLARCSGESKNVEKNEVISAVAELESLVEWAAQQPELGATSAVLLVKLHELHQIREDLEKNAIKTEENPVSEVTEGDSAFLEKSETYSKDLDYFSEIVADSLCESNCENVVEDDSASVDKDSLCDYSASTEDRNVANAGSPESLEDTNVEIIPSDDKTNDYFIQNKEYNSDEINEEKPALSNENVQDLALSQTPSAMDKEITQTQSGALQVRPKNLFRSDVIIIETDENNRSTEWANDFTNSNDPLDACMYAIRNLYESLRLKENELLKLSTMQNDQKHIEALQSVIIDFHKDITRLNSELEQSKRENSHLKEQVLELEEAENDARSEAQKLEQKLIFLQEKDSHSQAELTQLKQTLKKSTEHLEEKVALEKELRSQIKYMEALVQKYEDQIKTMEDQNKTMEDQNKTMENQNKTMEDQIKTMKDQIKTMEDQIKKMEDQIKTMEAKEIAASQDAENTSEPLINDNVENQEKRITCNRGTQTYEFLHKRINSNGEIVHDNNNNTGTNFNVSDSSNKSHESKDIDLEEEDTNHSTISPIPKKEIIQDSEQASTCDGPESISQKKLLMRLHKLIDEDVSLQQQIHYVDEINLAMWKKLQNLDCHIGECKKQNINETNPIVSENESINMLSEENLDSDKVESSVISTNENIPKEDFTCLDQNEKYIQQRLLKLEEINASFEKELQIREILCKEKAKKNEEWLEIKKRIVEDLKRIDQEKDWITKQINNLKKEIDAREKNIIMQEQALSNLKDKNQEEISKIKAHQEAVTEPLNVKVNQMLTKEKEILRMITNLKSEKNRSQGRSELEKLKCNYIELQLELSQAREEIRKIEERFKLQLDQCATKHMSEETQRCSELERLRNENSRCSKMIINLQRNQKDLANASEKQEAFLQEAQESHKQNLEATEEEHRSVETELESQLRKIEEGTVIATTALMEERIKVEKELQENIKDLKTKEEVYKAKIEKLESNVIDLHEELHKIAEDSETKKKDAESPDEVAENPVEISNPEAESINTTIEILTQPKEADASIKKFEINILGKSALTVKEVEAIEKQDRGKTPGKEIPEENVDELRAQVRELQSHIEKISSEAVEMPSAPPAKPITTSSLKMQTVEDIDYAEVDECCFDAWKKQNATPSADSAYSSQASGREKSASEVKYDKTSAEDSPEENDYDEVLPRPTNFHVVQRVGSDTLLVGWKYVNPSVLDGFEVYLNDKVHERIYIPDRTKALISGLNLKKPIRLCIFAISRYGQMSEPAVLELSPSQELHRSFFVDEEEYRDIEDPNCKQRPYSMEW